MAKNFPVDSGTDAFGQTYIAGCEPRAYKHVGPPPAAPGLKLCDCCQKSAPKGATFHDFELQSGRELDWCLCPNCTILCACRALPAKCVLQWRNVAGSTFITHADYYDKDGRALQPVIGGGDG